MKKTSYIATISTAFILSFAIISVCLAFSQILYSGSLIKFLPYGTALTLAGSGIAILTISLLSGIPVAVARPQDEPFPLIILMIQAMALHFNSGQEAFLTILISIALTTFLTGILLFAFGFFRWGIFVRFVPFPVIAGFLAGSGLLLIINGLNQIFAIDELSLTYIVNYLSNTAHLLLWLPSVLFGIALFYTSERIEHPLMLPALMVTGIILFYVIFFFSSQTLSSLKSMGLLLDAHNLSIDKLITHINSSQTINWSLIQKNLGAMIVVAVVSVISLLFITMSVELILKKEVDFNKELKIAGIANIFASSTVGLVSYHGLGNSVLSIKLNAANRIVGILCALSCLLSIFFIEAIIGYFPRYMLIGLILFLGLSLFYKWTFSILEKLGFLDRVLLFIVIFIMICFGFLQGMLTGIVIAILFFTFTYSRLKVIKYTMDGHELSSSYERELQEKIILKQNGGKIFYLKLQGYLFFGSSNILVNQVRNMLLSEKYKMVEFIIIDMSQVSGIDTSTTMSFDRIHEYALDQNIIIILTGFSEQNSSLKTRISKIISNSSFLMIPLVDDAINHCELTILKEAGYDLNLIKNRYISLEDFLGDKAFSDDIKKYFEDIKLNVGEYLVHQNDLSHDVFYLESGSLSVFIQFPDNRKKILSVIGPGNFIGEIAFYLHSERSASIVAKDECRIKKLNQKNLKIMKKESPDLAHAFEQAIICVLAFKLVDTTKKIEILSK